MHNNHYIKNFFAVLLLAVFALSNTPTKYLHQLFANHTDFVNKTTTATDSPQLNVSGIDCHCNSTVVIVPFTCDNEILIQKTPSLFASHIISDVPDISFPQLFFFELRGPPTIA